MDGGRLPLPLLQPVQPRSFHPTERPELSPRPWCNNSSERQGLTDKRVEVDKDVARNMDSVFKELLGKTTLKHMGTEEPLTPPEPPDPPKSNFVGKKGTPAKHGPANRVLLRGRGVFKSTGNGE
uniref:Uncharacterized protein n=1 Tax=Sphaerodactylus townsendi TaxID=933632 RepID=A0ACB8ELH9_9SAUR